MKTIYFYILLATFSFSNCFSQTFRAAFDKSDYSNTYHNGNGTSFYCNTISYNNSSTDCGGVPEPGADTHAYLLMYRATKDKKYLDKFIIQSKRVQERRDDNIQNIYLHTPLAIANPSICTPYPNNTPVPDNTNYDGHISKGWSYDEGFANKNNPEVICCHDWSPTPLYMGKIMFPMAEFVYMVKVEFADDLQNLTLPDEANGVNQYKNQYGATYDISEGVISMATYLDYANWLEKRLQGTFDFLESDYWETGTDNLCSYDNSIAFGGYSAVVPHPPAVNNSYIADINQQCAMGKTLVYMYLASDAGTYKNLYYDHVVNIARNLWCQLNTHLNPLPPNIPSNLYQASEGFWSWCGEYNCSNGLWEDIGHGIEEAEFLELCYRYGMEYPDETPLFSDNTMKRMANTLAYIICINPLNFSRNVAGDLPTENVNWTAAYWGFLIPYNPYIYQELSDVVAPDCIYNNEPGTVQTAYLALAQSPYVYANIHSFYSNANALQGSNYKFNPIAVRQGHSPGSNVYYLASGDFDNNGLKDFVSMDFSNGTFYTYTPDICDNPNITSGTGANCWVVAHSGSHTPYDAWKGIAGGNFDANRPGDEIMALNNTDGNIYVLKQNNTGGFNEETSSSSITWAGLTAGDFDPNNPGDEGIAVATNGDAYMLRYNSNIQPVFISNLGINNIVGITSGDFDGSHIPQIAVVDNSPGYITIFKYQNGTFAQAYQYSGAGCCNSWNGITAGSFDGDGIDDIAVHRDADGQILIYKVKNGSITPVYGEYFPTYPSSANESIRAMGTGKYKLSTDKDALIVFRNYDGQITIFNLDGQCPNAYVSNTTVNSDYTINNTYTNTNNNYTVDYHANNTLYASNFTVGDPNSSLHDNSKVEFVAGNKIIVSPGTTGSAAYSGSSFHAYIDAVDFGCGSHAVFKPTSSNSPSHSNNPTLATVKKDTVTKKKNTALNASFIISPNPNNGNMQVTYEIPENTTGTFEVYNPIGEKLFSYPIYSGKNTFSISHSDLNQGVYFYRAMAGNKLIGKDKIVVIK